MICSKCLYWNSDPHDNGMGVCTGMQSSGLLEFNVGSEALGELEILTSHNMGCVIPELQLIAEKQ